MTSLPRSDFTVPRAVPPPRKTGTGSSSSKDYVNLRRRSRLGFGHVLLMAAATAALVFLFMRYFGTPGDIRAGALESTLGLPNARGDCLARIQYANLANDAAEEALVLTRPGCAEEGLAVSVYGLVNGQIAPIWGSAQEPALVVGSGEVSVSDDGLIVVREVDSESPLNKSGFLPHPQVDRHRVYQSVTGGFAVGETWHDPVLLGQVQGTGGCLNVRAAASTVAAVVGCIQDGETMVIAGGPEASGGMTWWLRADGGWVAGTYLKLFAGSDPSKTPSP